MAKLDGGIKYVGTIQELSAYKMRGVEGIVLRRSKGPSKKQIKTSPSFENVRRNNSEWIATTGAAAGLRRAMHHITHVADYNLSGPLNAFTRQILKLAETGDWGTRPVLYSQHKDRLVGYSFNKQHLFDSIVRSPVNCIISRETFTATLQLPPLQPDLQLKLPWKQPVYRFIAQLGLAADCMWNAERKRYNAPHHERFGSVEANTEWLGTTTRFEGRTIELVFPEPGRINDNTTLVVSIGIEMGNLVIPGVIDRVKYAGSGKILALG